MSKKSKQLVEFPQAEKLTQEEAAKLIPNHASRYDAVIEQLTGMKPGGVLRFQFSDGIDVRKVISNLSSAMINRGIKAPKGHAYYKTVDNKNGLIVMVKPRKEKSGSKGK